MATKKGPAKKTSAKKSSTSKSAAKKSAQKAAAAGVSAGVGIMPPNIRCILACIERYNQCLKKGVKPATCQLRLWRCLQRCFSGGVFDPTDEE